MYYLTALPAAYLMRQLGARLRGRLRTYGVAAEQSITRCGSVGQPSGIAPSPLQDLALIRPARLDDQLAAYLADQYCSKRFDLLGTGWVDSSYHTAATGLGGYVYEGNLRLPDDLADGAWLQHVVHGRDLPNSTRLWSLLRGIKPDYQPIDWQRDRKSGFRWSAQEPDHRQSARSRGYPGADIIQPWELSRLQHLPRMALLALHLPGRRREILHELQCQVLDFATTNPVGMGVNWACTMDVAIRAANLVLTHWLLTAQNPHTQFSPGFEHEFIGLLYRHGHFIRDNLEYNAGNSGNHYLANLTGLLFVTAFFEPDRHTREWEQLAVRELEREARRQFYPDGGHFEGSTCYHALCTELLVYGAALGSRNRDGPAMPESLYLLLGRARSLLSRLVGPGGDLVQFGDNDSGRLFRLAPHGRFITAAEARGRYVNLAAYSAPDSEPYFDENLLDYSGITDAFHPGTLEHQLLSALGTPALFAEPTAPWPPRLAAAAVGVRRPQLRYSASRHFYSSSDLRAGLSIYCYPDAGIYLAQSTHLFLAVSAHANPRQKLNLSHNHNDKLALELHIDGAAVLSDPGSYVYTPLPSTRDQFRSVRAHNTLQVDGLEQNRFVDSFVSYPDARCTLLESSEHAIELALAYRGIKQRRRIEITHSAVIVTDLCNRPFRQCWNDFPWQSVGYGKLRSRR